MLGVTYHKDDSVNSLVQFVQDFEWRWLLHLAMVNSLSCP